MSAQDAEALELWLTGRATRWPFETDFYSDSGKASAPSGATVSIVSAPHVPHFGTQYLQLNPLLLTTSVAMTVPTLFDGSYTVSWWQWIDEAGYDAWHHVVERYDHTTNVTTYLYDNVSVGAGFITNYTLVSVLGSGGNITLTIKSRTHNNSADAEVWVTDVVISPFPWTAAMVTAVFTSADRFGASPRMFMRGDLLDAVTLPNPLEVRAEVKDIGFMQGRRSGEAFANNLRRVAFTLTEVVGAVRP